MLTQTPTRPLVRYLGGKWILGPWIISHFPPHKAYVEPFGGGASILLRKPRAFAEVYNDAEGEIVNLFRMVRTRGPELIDAVKLTPFARDEYEAAFVVEPSDDLDRARMTLVKTWMGRGSNNIRKRSGFRKYFGSEARPSRSTAAEWRNLPDAIALVVERLQGVTIENRDAIHVMQAHDAPDTLHYVDPPYTHKERGTDSRYRLEFSEADHRRLAEALNAMRGRVVLSGYRSDLYDDLYQGWVRLDKTTFADGGRKRVESLWLSPNIQQARLI